MTEQQLNDIHNLAVLVAAKNVLADLRPGDLKNLGSFSKNTVDPYIEIFNLRINRIELES